MKTVIAKCIFKKVYVGLHEKAGLGLWWDLEIENIPTMQNPIKADMHFIKLMLDLFNIDNILHLNLKTCKVEYSYSPTFHIHKFINGDNELNLDYYLYKIYQSKSFNN